MKSGDYYGIFELYLAEFIDLLVERHLVVFTILVGALITVVYLSISFFSASPQMSDPGTYLLLFLPCSPRLLFITLDDFKEENEEKISAAKFSRSSGRKGTPVSGNGAATRRRSSCEQVLIIERHYFLILL